MRKFLYSVFLFCMPVFVIVCFGEFYMRNRPSIYGLKNKQVLSNADSIEVLILGNSHTTYGIYPEKLTPYAYSLAFEDQSIYYDKRLIEKYLPVLSHLKYVFIGIDYHNLAFEHVPNRDFFYQYYYDIDYKNTKFRKEYFLQSFFVYSLKTTWSIIYNDIITGQQVFMGPRGGVNRAMSSYDAVTSVEKNKMKAALFNENKYRYDNNSQIIKDLEWIITTLQSKNIMPILITCPSYRVMRECIDKSILDKCLFTVDSLSKKYDIPYLNYLNDDGYEISDYYDGDHLNIFGAFKFTEKIDSVIVQMERDKQYE